MKVLDIRSFLLLERIFSEDEFENGLKSISDQALISASKDPNSDVRNSAVEALSERHILHLLKETIIK